jgi:hypothetical protein
MRTSSTSPPPLHIHSTGISSWPTMVQSSWWRLWSVFMAHTVFKDPYPSITHLSIWRKSLRLDTGSRQCYSSNYHHKDAHKNFFVIKKVTFPLALWKCLKASSCHGWVLHVSLGPIRKDLDRNSERSLCPHMSQVRKEACPVTHNVSLMDAVTDPIGSKSYCQMPLVETPWLQLWDPGEGTDDPGVRVSAFLSLAHYLFLAPCHIMAS